MVALLQMATTLALLVVFSHKQVFFLCETERTLQWLYNRHVDAVRSDTNPIPSSAPSLSRTQA